MIFVTVGASLPFDRLIRHIDIKIAPQLETKFFAQIHDSATYIPQNIDYVKTENRKSFEDHIRGSDLVISHAGMGVILDCIKHNKKLILVPRDPLLGEHIDGHQYEICNYLKKNNKDVSIINDINLLNELIIKKIAAPIPIYENSKRNLIDLKNNIFKYLSKNFIMNKKIFIACSSGGHLRQMVELLDVFPKEKIVFITNSTKIEFEGIKTYIVKGDFTDKFLPIRSLVMAPFLYLKYRPSVLFTNGGGELSFPFSFFGKLFGSEIIFLETISRVDSKSKAAQLVYPIADIFLIQWEKNLSKYGKKAKYWGSVI